MHAIFCWNCLQSKYHCNCHLQLTQHTSCHCLRVCARASWSPQKQLNTARQECLIDANSSPTCLRKQTSVLLQRQLRKVRRELLFLIPFYRNVPPEEGFCHTRLQSSHSLAICEYGYTRRGGNTQMSQCRLLSDRMWFSVLYTLTFPHPFSFGQNIFFFFSKKGLNGVFSEFDNENSLQPQSSWGLWWMFHFWWIPEAGHAKPVCPMLKVFTWHKSSP